MSQSAAKKPAPPLRAPEENQREASDPKASVWVGASAGSGKTTVLTDRVTRLLLDGVAPQKILCLTFTRAAAAEVANRITEKLSLWATCDEEELRHSLDKLQGQPPLPAQLKKARQLFAHVLSCPGGMRIRTLHAFCQEILGRFPIEARLPPHFAVIDEADTNELIEQAQADVLRELAQSPDSPAACALKFLTLDIGENRFAEAIKDVLHERAPLLAAVSKAGDLDRLAAQIRGFLGVSPGVLRGQIVRAAVDFDTLPHADIRQAAAWICEGTPRYSERAQKILDWLKHPPERRAAEFDVYCRGFFTDKGQPYAEFANGNILAAYPRLDEIMRREVTRLESVIEQLEALGIAEVTEAVLRLGMEIVTRYEKRKAAQAALDYDDLIIRTNALLHRPGVAPWILYKLDGGIDHILIDEAQDTSRAQWSIVQALADEFFGGSGARDNVKRTLFAVGDEKQSIFSFQDADPEAFTEMRNYFSQRLEESGDTLRHVPLHTSFRSAPAILTAVDAVFAQPRAQAGVSMEPVHHFAAQPRAGEAAKAGRVEVWPLCSAPEKTKDKSDVWDMPTTYEEEHDPQAELAAMIATKIESGIKAKEFEAGDVMVLLRRRGRFADLMVRALKQRKVPVTGVDRMKLTQQLPVMDLLALMQFALLPEDDLNLATVLRGPLLNASEDQLMQLAAGRKGSLWGSLRENAKTDPAAAAMETYLLEWLKEADFITPFAFLTRLFKSALPRQ